MYKLELNKEIKHRHLESYYDAIHDSLEYLANGGVLKYGHNVFKLSQESYCVRGLFRLLLSYNKSREESILISSPNYHWQLIKEFERYVSVHKWRRKDSPLEECLRVITWIFSYDRFKNGVGLKFDAEVGKAKGFASNWSPMEYIKALDVRYCPYCNAESIYAIKDLQLNARSALDHYFPKSQYPYLAISLCNLIPSCTRCNTDIKKDRELDYGVHLHPFVESFHNGARFMYIPMNQSVALRPEDVQNADDFELEVNERANKAGRDECKRAKALGNFFKLGTVYNLLFKPEALRAIYRCRVMGSQYFDMVRETLHENLNDSQIRALFAEEVADEKEINKVRLSKLVLDTEEWVQESRK